MSKDIARVVAGRKAKQNGKMFESLLQNVFTLYENRAIMKVEKAHENFKPLRPLGNGQYVCVSCSSGQPDFRGCTRTGRSVVFEAKHTESDQIAYKAVTVAEENNLIGYDKLNSLCAVLVQYGSGNIYCIPWVLWHNMKAIFGHLHIKESEIQEYKADWIYNVTDNVGVILQDITLKAKALVSGKAVKE